MYKICPNLCGDCPFSKNSLPGFLADYTIEDFMEFQRVEYPFPCHKQLESDLPADLVENLVIDGKLMVCRGYAESMKMSCKVPRNRDFARALESIEISGDALSIFDFVKHHSQYEKKI